MASIKDLKRMCKNMTCKDCQLSGSNAADCWMFALPYSYPDEDIDAIVDKWVEEHGFETEGYPVKTYAMDFFEKFPNAPKDRNGAPMACWKHVYGDGNDCGSGGCIECSCIECWEREMKEQ